jgi:ketosteroid isomerase-like protein
METHRERLHHQHAEKVRARGGLVSPQQSEVEGSHPELEGPENRAHQLEGLSEAVKGVVEVYETFNIDPQGALAGLSQLYAEEMRFQDPLISIEGRAEFERVMGSFVSNARQLRIEVLDHAEQGDRAFITWRMWFAPRWGRGITIEAVSHLRLREGRVVEQRDYWDLVDSLVSRLPWASRAYHGFMRRVA